MGLLNKVYNLVWYGDCSDPECQTINLSAWTDDIDFVFQVSDVNNGWKHWSAQTDGVSLSDFDQLVCGIPYVIKLKSDDKVNPNNPIDIPDVVVGTFAQDEDDTTPRRITEYCNPVRDCSFITDEPTDGRFDLTINMSTLDSAGTNGFIRGIEIEFADNVELDDTEVVSVTFDQKYIMALGAGDTENSTLFKELADRSKTMLTFGSVSNKRNKFGFMDLREAGQGISYEKEKRSNFRFKIPYKSLDGDVRVVSAKIYDTSVDRKVYDYVLCDPIVGPCIDCDTWQGEGTSFTYPLSTTSVASAEHNLSAIWYDTESENAKLCYGDSDPELPKTYYAFFNEEKIPRGAITITGKLKGDKRIAYVKGEEIFIGLPGVEMADGADYEIDVYRFTPCGDVEPSDTPTPTPTNTKTPTKTPTKTETPSKSKTETPENLEATPTPSKTKSPSKTPTKTKTPSKSKSITPEKQIECCDELNELVVPISSDSIKLTDNITAMPFVHGGKLCLGELTEGFPSSVTLYIKLNEETTVYLGTLGIFGSFDSSNNLVRFVITQLSDDASDLEKELNEECLEGTINANGDCVLQSISNKNIQPTPSKTASPSDTPTLTHPNEQPTPSPSQSPSESYVKPDDTLFAIGENQHLINSSKVANLLYPEPTTVNNSGDNILQFEVTDYGNLILKEDGSLWSSGDIIKTNEDPKYHPQNGFYRGEFYKVDDGIEYIRASNSAIYFKRVNDNKLYARPRSYHSYAQSAIGLENDNNTSLPEYPQVVIKDDDSPLENIVQISIEHKLTVFRTSDGKVYGAGQDDVQWNVFGLDSKPKTKATLLATEELDGNTISAVIADNGVLVLQDTGKLYRVGAVSHYARNLFPEKQNAPGHSTLVQNTFYNFTDKVTRIFESGLLEKEDKCLYAPDINRAGSHNGRQVGLGILYKVQDTDGNDIKNVKYAKTFLANASTYNFTNNSNASVILRNNGQIFVATTNDYQPLKYENGTSVKNVDAVKPGFYNILMTFLDEEVRYTPTPSPSKTITPTKTPSMSKSQSHTKTPDTWNPTIFNGSYHYGRSGISVATNEDGTSFIAGGSGQSSYTHDYATGTGQNWHQGHARVYHKNSNGIFVMKGTDILASKPDTGISGKESVGKCVDMSADGNIIAVGSPSYAHNSDSTILGRVRVFEWNGGAWQQKGGDLFHSGGSAGEACGNSVALSADGTICAFSVDVDQDGKDHIGGISVCKFNGTSWVQYAPLIVLTDWNEGGFRPYVRMSDNGDRLVVAMRNKQNNNALAHNGLVQTYRKTSSGYTKHKQYSDTNAYYFGWGKGVDISGDGNTISIGVAWKDKTNINKGGKVGIYGWNSSSPYQTIDSDDRYFGQSVALNKDGTKLIVGSKPLTPADAGKVQIYKRPHPTAQFALQFEEHSNKEGMTLGQNVAISKDGNFAISGNPDDTVMNAVNTPDGGSVRVYEWGI